MGAGNDRLVLSAASTNASAAATGPSSESLSLDGSTVAYSRCRDSPASGFDRLPGLPGDRRSRHHPGFRYPRPGHCWRPGTDGDHRAGPTVDSPDPGAGLTVNGGSADDQLSVSSIDSGWSNGSALTLDGQSGTHAVSLPGSFNLNGGALSVTSESISVGSGATLSGLGSLTFTALASDGSLITDTALLKARAASITIDGSLVSTGPITIGAEVSRNIDVEQTGGLDVALSSSSDRERAGGPGCLAERRLHRHQRADRRPRGRRGWWRSLGRLH